MQRKYKLFPRLMFRLRLWQGVNFEKEMRLLDILCGRGKSSIDVGAKLGMYTYRLVRHSNHVIAFEPIPLLVRMLESTFNRREVTVEQRALSDEAGHIVMRIPYGSNGEVKFGRSTIERQNTLTHDDVAFTEQIAVYRTTLDAYALSNVGFIKIDVEGHELPVLRGASATIARERPTLLVEANDHHHPGAVAQLRAFLDELDYSVLFWDERGLNAITSPGDVEYCRDATIENFICVHRSHPDIREQLAERVAVTPTS